MAWSQNGRDMAIVTVLHKKDPSILLLSTVEVVEYISRPFHYKCIVLCGVRGHGINPAALIGTWATVWIRSPGPYFKQLSHYYPRAGVIRSFKPIYAQADRQQGGDQPPVSDPTIRTYVLEIVPWLSFLDLTTDFRIFQDKTVVEILDEVLNEEIVEKSWSHPDLLNLTKLKNSQYKYPKIEYCVQCRESTFNFVSRLMEEYGIFYYFDHGNAPEHLEDDPHPFFWPDEPRTSQLVLGDGNEHIESNDQSVIQLIEIPGSAGDAGGTLTGWDHQWQPRSGAWILGENNFVQPTDPIKSEGPEGRSPLGYKEYSRYDFPDRAVDAEDEERRVRRREEAELTGREVIQGSSSNCRSFYAGFKFAFFPDANDEENSLTPEEPFYGRGYVLTDLQWNANDPSYEEVSWAGIAKVVEDDMSPAPAVASGTGNVTQNLPPTYTASSGTWTDYPGINLFSWFTGGMLSKVASDLVSYFFKDRSLVYNLKFTAVPLEFAR